MAFTTCGKKPSDSCLHIHYSMDEAQKCLLKHQSEQRQKNKLSFRTILEIDEHYASQFETFEDYLWDVLTPF